MKWSVWLNQLNYLFFCCFTMFHSSFFFFLVWITLTSVWHSKRGRIEYKNNNNRIHKNVFNVFPLVLISFEVSLYFIGFYHRFITDLFFYSTHLTSMKTFDARHFTFFFLSLLFILVSLCIEAQDKMQVSCRRRSHVKSPKVQGENISDLFFFDVRSHK